MDGALQALRMRKRKIPSSLLAIDTRRLRSYCVEGLFGLADQQRVILLVHLCLNTITLLELSHHLSRFIGSQTYFLAVLPLDEIVPVFDAQQFARDRLGAC